MADTDLDPTELNQPQAGGAAHVSNGVSAVQPEEYRAYLQRGETRLSTLHRVAGTFISGAGLLTLLPILISNVFSGLLAGLVFRRASGIPSPGSWERWVVLAPVLASMALPLAALYLLIRDLTQFYFTARSFRNDPGEGTYPRFILSGLMVPSSSRSPEMSDARQDAFVLDLMVPATSPLRARLLKEAHTVGVMRRYDLTDDSKVLTKHFREFLLDETGSSVRTLSGESAKMEASLVRHQRYLRSLVLRYAKAFLLTIITTIFTIVASGTLSLLNSTSSDSSPIEGVRPDFVWLSTLTIYAIWCVTAAVVVRRPIDWVFSEIQNTRSQQTPPSLQSFERATVVTVAISMLALDAVLIMATIESSDNLKWWPVTTMLLASLGVGFAVGRVILTELRAGKAQAY